MLLEQCHAKIAISNEISEDHNNVCSAIERANFGFRTLKLSSQVGVKNHYFVVKTCKTATFDCYYENHMLKNEHVLIDRLDDINSTISHNFNNC